MEFMVNGYPVATVGGVISAAVLKSQALVFRALVFRSLVFRGLVFIPTDCLAKQ